MNKVLLTILLILLLGMIWSFPLFICANLVLWLFHIPAYLNLPQAFGLCLLASVIRHLLFGNKEDN